MYDIAAVEICIHGGAVRVVQQGGPEAVRLPAQCQQSGARAGGGAAYHHLQRTPSGVVITNEGRELLKLGNKLLRDADYIDEYFHAGGEGRRPSLFVSSQHYDFVVAAFEDFGPRRRMTGIPWGSTRTRHPWSSTMCGGSTATWGCFSCRT